MLEPREGVFYCDCGARQDGGGDGDALCFPQPCNCSGILGRIRQRRWRLRNEMVNGTGAVERVRQTRSEIRRQTRSARSQDAVHTAQPKA
jgi:hypothetical protein